MSTHRPPAQAPPAIHETGEAANAKMAGFCRLLRQHGFGVGHGETLDALRVAEGFLFSDFPAFQSGLRSLMCNRLEQLEPFDRLFEGYWCPADGASRIVPLQEQPRPLREQRGDGVEVALGFGERPPFGEDDQVTGGASTLERLRRVDFSKLPEADQPLLDALARRLWRRMALRLNRRLQGARVTNAIHFRRTFRRNLSRGGEPVELVPRGRKPRKPRLVVLLDVSGSMELYSFVFLRLLHALQGAFRRVNSFVFSTDLEEITAPLDTATLQEALAAMARLRLGWNGGTRIGDALWHLVDMHGGRVLRRDTVVVVLSDGLDTGEPERLAGALQRIQLCCRRVIWLNPLLGMEGYQPLARGMAAALPHLNAFAPAHNLEALLKLESLLLNPGKS